MLWEVNRVQHLLLCSVSMNDVNVDSIVRELMEEIFRSVFGLDKYQHRRLETLHSKLNKWRLSSWHISVVLMPPPDTKIVKDKSSYTFSI